MDAGIEPNRALPRGAKEMNDSSKLERKTRVRSIKFNLEPIEQEGKQEGKMNRAHSSDTDLIIGILKSTTKTTRGGRPGRKKGVLRKTGGTESLARMKEEVNDQQKTHSSCGNLDLAEHMTKLKEKQGGGGGLPSWFCQSDPSLRALDLSDFDKGGPRSRRRSSRGKKVPLQRRSYPSSRFCETELPQLVPFPSGTMATFGRLSPVFIDWDTVQSKVTVSNVLDKDSERFATELPAVTPEKNDSAATTA